MNLLNLLNITAARVHRVHLKTKEDVIALVVTLVVYFGVNNLLQTVKPDMEQKKINIISLVIGAAAMIVCMVLLH